MQIAQKTRHLKTLAIIMLLVGFLVGGFLIYYNNRSAQAADLKKFNAGNIISDSVFYNYSTMSASQIQDFLNSKVKSCNGDYTCLKDYRSSTVSKPVDSYCSGYNASSSQSAAEIIYGVSQSCKINPQVLLVLLQKETGLVTHTGPGSWRYQTATGMGCPDTAACDSQYYGLFNQLYGAARQFKIYQAKPSNYRYVANRNNSIQWNPSASCGSTNVYIENQATAGLYNYTPYAPNQAALNAGYGTGNGCSSYGNRNFYLYFTDWFGNTANNQNISVISSLPDGDYYIASTLNTAKSAGFSSLPGDNITFMILPKATNETIFKLNKNQDRSYTLTNTKTGKVVDTPNANITSGQSLQQYSSNGSDAQRWNIYNNSDGTYTITPKISSALAIDISGGIANDKANMQLYAQNSTAAQRFYLVPVNQPVINGDYFLESSLSNSLVIDATGGSTADSTKVQIYKKNYTSSQKWIFSYNASTGYYDIIGKNSRKALDVRDGSISAGSGIQIFTSNGTCAQKWRVEKFDNGQYELLSSCSDLAIDIPGGDIVSGKALQLWGRNESGAQRWNITAVNKTELSTTGQYELVSKLNTNKVIDVAGGEIKNSTKVQIYDRNNSNAQRWVVSYDDESNLYAIKNVGSNKVLDLTDGNVASGTRLQIYEPNGTCAQQWSLVRSLDESFDIKSACSSLQSIDLRDASIINGSAIQIYNSNDSQAQRWLFRKVN